MRRPWSQRLPSGPRRDGALDAPARLGVDGDAGLDRLELAGRNAGKRLLDQFGNLGKCETTIQERRHRDLVSGVEHDRSRSAQVEGLARQPQAGKARGIRLEERELTYAREIQSRRWGRPALRIRERIEDRDAHVGNTELSDDGAVDVL